MRFNIKVNDGKEQYLHVKTSIYRDAAAAVPAMLGLDLPVDVEIWCEGISSGSFRYRIRENVFGGIEVEHMALTRR